MNRRTILSLTATVFMVAVVVFALNASSDDSNAAQYEIGPMNGDCIFFEGDFKYVVTTLRNVDTDTKETVAVLYTPAVSEGSCTIPDVVTAPSGTKIYDTNGNKRTLTSDVPYAVKAIAPNAFTYGDNITDISFTSPSKIKMIGDKAFSGRSDLSVPILPSSVEYIGSEVFKDCKYISELVVRKDTVIDEGAFRNSGLRSVTFDDNVTDPAIGNNAFDSCTSLITVTMGSSMENIDWNVFKDCHSLVRVVNRSTMEVKASDLSKCSYNVLSIRADDESSRLRVADDGNLIFLEIDGRFYLVKCFTTGKTDYYMPNSDYQLGSNRLGSYSIIDYAFENSDIETLHIYKNVSSVQRLAYSGADQMRVLEEDNLFAGNNYVYFGLFIVGWLILVFTLLGWSKGHKLR